jgi:hypothetical protein
MLSVADRKGRFRGEGTRNLAEAASRHRDQHHGIKCIASYRVMDPRQFATDCAPQGTVLRQNRFNALAVRKGLLSGAEKDYCPLLVCYWTITAS